jgi:hypothetical protein
MLSAFDVACASDPAELVIRTVETLVRIRIVSLLFPLC